jgi:FtsP/CotA-like multicopper oxidase with cupredoxin domain
MEEFKSFSALTRREFLTVAGLGAGTIALSSCGLWPLGTGNTNTSLPFQHATSTGQVRAYTFEAAPLNYVFDGKHISTWAYNGGVPGPEIRVTEGDTVRVTVKNRLPEGTTIHWHGVPLVNTMDGVPDVTQPAIKPGQDFTYEFLAPTAGTYMYHSHSGLQLDRGLYGPFIIESAKEVKNYDDEFVLVLDDWLDGMPGTPEDAMKQLIAGGDRMGGMNGNGNMGGMNGNGNMASSQVPPDLVYPLYLINGTSSNYPTTMEVKQGQKVRIRLINASAATIYRVALQGHRMTVTHTDGQAVSPVEVDAIRIGMGERYDVLVSATNPGVWQFAAQVEGAKNMVRAIFRYQGNMSALPAANYQPPELTHQVLSYSMLKAAPGLVVPPNKNPDQIVPIQLSGGMGQYVWKMNGQVMEKAAPIAVKQNGLIRFQFESTSMMPHPMHLHGHFFQVENGTGRGPLKDTILVDPMQKLTVNWVADNPGSWAFHCHNRYHEQAGMMRIIKVG